MRGAEQTENLVDEGTKKIPITSWRWSMMIGGIRGDECEGKDWGWFSCAALSNIWCQEMGIVCVPSWISMRQKGGDVVDAAWQNPPLRGEESIGSQAMRGCHVRKGLWYHTVRYGGIACCQMLSALFVLCELGVHTLREKVHCSISRLCPYVGQVVMFCVSPRFQLNLIICDAPSPINSGQQEFTSI